MDRTLAFWLWAAGAIDHLKLVIESKPPLAEPHVDDILTPLHWSAPEDAAAAGLLVNNEASEIERKLSLSTLFIVSGSTPTHGLAPSEIMV